MSIFDDLAQLFDFGDGEFDLGGLLAGILQILLSPLYFLGLFFGPILGFPY